jgi:hypothetical protein
LLLPIPGEHEYRHPKRPEKGIILKVTEKPIAELSDSFAAKPL